ncbi:GNAT family N-acetyltransferase [Crocosphaera chwakensis]|uniref:GCN5-related N-acetyltransferase n=1 Tax=Crocosphaera chwakensis CCY0110 TaxID=391612 RepID=A3INN2_9CHRO|nr:GNAT family N-acetyltransferase [Crocosphaera chwakensis]EAZ91930.1 GCN5-related N-acetyltransferase [Crocosphaera chwakensis CCY0110]
MDTISIRLAQPSDGKNIANFNQAMAKETENKVLVPHVILAGVNTLLKNPSQGFYIVAEVDSKVVGCLMITREWSDWRNGVFWWIQSVFVLKNYRRRGVYRRMYEFVKELASNKEDVCGFRLYVEQDNLIAQETYNALGMKQLPYLMFEQPKPE